MKLIKTVQLTDFPDGAAAHDQSGNTSSLCGSLLGFRRGNAEKFSLIDLTKKAIFEGGQVREQYWHDKYAVVQWKSSSEVYINGVLLTLPAIDSPGFIRWTIVPAAENDLSKHGDNIWFRRVAWVEGKVSPIYFACWTRSTGNTEIIKLADISPEKDPFRKQELHACHQDRGQLLWMHERERSGHYNRDTFEKCWYVRRTLGTTVTKVGIGFDHPTFRNGVLLFTGAKEIVDRWGVSQEIKFRNDDQYQENCLHQFLDESYNLVCSIQSRKGFNGVFGPWLETEIRVYEPSGKVIASIPLTQPDQSESGNAFALLSRPFSGRVEELGYCVFYHAPSPADLKKPIEQRVPQIWMAVFDEQDKPVDPEPEPDLIHKLESAIALAHTKIIMLENWHAALKADHQETQQRLDDLLAYVKQEFSRPLTVVKGPVS